MDSVSHEISLQVSYKFSLSAFTSMTIALGEKPSSEYRINGNQFLIREFMLCLCGDALNVAGRTPPKKREKGRRSAWLGELRLSPLSAMGYAKTFAASCLGVTSGRQWIQLDIKNQKIQREFKWNITGRAERQAPPVDALTHRAARIIGSGR
jgi:hypothetical protein